MLAGIASVLGFAAAVFIAKPIEIETGDIILFPVAGPLVSWTVTGNIAGPGGGVTLLHCSDWTNGLGTNLATVTYDGGKWDGNNGGTSPTIHEIVTGGNALGFPSDTIYRLHAWSSPPTFPSFMVQWTETGGTPTVGQHKAWRYYMHWDFDNGEDIGGMHYLHFGRIDADNPFEMVHKMSGTAPNLDFEIEYGIATLTEFSRDVHYPLTTNKTYMVEAHAYRPHADSLGTMRVWIWDADADPNTLVATHALVYDDETHTTAMRLDTVKAWFIDDTDKTIVWDANELGNNGPVAMDIAQTPEQYVFFDAFATAILTDSTQRIGAYSAGECAG